TDQTSGDGSAQRGHFLPSCFPCPGYLRSFRLLGVIFYLGGWFGGRLSNRLFYFLGILRILFSDSSVFACSFDSGWIDSFFCQYFGSCRRSMAGGVACFVRSSCAGIFL